MKVDTSGNTKRIIYLDYESIKIIMSSFTALIILLYGRWMVMGGTTPQFKAIDNPAAFSEDFVTKVIYSKLLFYFNNDYTVKLK